MTKVGWLPESYSSLFYPAADTDPVPMLRHSIQLHTYCRSEREPGAT